jgi:hypothetical protein
LFIYTGMWQRPAECLRLPRVSVERWQTDRPWGFPLSRGS